MVKLTKTILARVLWLARGTATTLGLAVMLAVVLGVATMALGAVPGDPFKLGQINTIDVASGLAGSIQTPMLAVENRFDVANVKGGEALALKVAPGRAPVRVNPEAGTAIDLSADELDGKDSTGFLSSRTYLVEGTNAGPGGGGEASVFASCDPGDRVLSGGSKGLRGAEVVKEDRPIADATTQRWSVIYDDFGAPGGVVAVALCSDLPPLRP
jgi:hypothetical protein